MPSVLTRLPVFLQISLLAILLTALGWWAVPDEGSGYRPDQLPWNSYRDDEGRVHALGLTLGASTLQDAMRLYGRDVEVKLFTDADLTPVSVEAFFPTIYIGAIKSPMILKLNVPFERMQALLKETPGIRAAPTSGDKEALLSDFQARSLLTAPIDAITLIVKDLPEAAIIKRFGQPADRRTYTSDDTTRWRYPRKGLEIVITPDGPDLLQWSNTAFSSSF